MVFHLVPYAAVLFLFVFIDDVLRARAKEKNDVVPTIFCCCARVFVFERFEMDDYSRGLQERCARARARTRVVKRACACSA